MERVTIEVGTKLILIRRFNRRIINITTDIITKENKTTVSTKKKQLISKQSYSYFRFYNNQEYSRTSVICDNSKGKFHPDDIQKFDQVKYNSMIKEIQMDKAKQKAKLEASQLHKEKYAIAFKEYADLRQKMYEEAQPILRDSFIKNMCKSCNNYQLNGTCKFDNDFYSVGKITSTKSRFFDSMSTMCKWESKENG